MKPKQTWPEILLTKALRERGLAFSTNSRGLLGTPDIVFHRQKFVVFVHGCYWHRHHLCPRSRIPRKDALLWLRRFAQNVRHDQLVARRLRLDGWWIFVAWECEILRDPELVGAEVARELGRRNEIRG
jgi:DNA mismatch endonuclease, patch repair protein